jgi:rare lipoprotein A
LLRFILSQLLLVLVLAAGLLVFGSDRAEAALASWYGPGFQGLPTATGEHFNAYGGTVTHKTLPLGTELLVSYGGNTARVVVNGRGP